MCTLLHARISTFLFRLPQHPSTTARASCPRNSPRIIFHACHAVAAFLFNSSQLPTDACQQYVLSWHEPRPGWQYGTSSCRVAFVMLSHPSHSISFTRSVLSHNLRSAWALWPCACHLLKHKCMPLVPACAQTLCYCGLSYGCMARQHFSCSWCATHATLLAS